MARIYSWVAGHRRGVMGLYLVATVISVWLCSRLRLDSDLINLLPADIPAVKSVRKLQGWSGSLAFMYLGLVRDDRTTVQQLQRFAAAIGPELEKSQWVRKPVSVGVDVAGIKKGVALFLDPEDLEIVGKRLEESVKAERKKKSGFFLDLEDAAADPAKPMFEDLVPKYRKRLQWAAGEAAAGGDQLGAMLSRLRAKISEDGRRLYFLSDDRKMLTFVFHPTFPPEVLTHYLDLVADVDRAVAAARNKVDGADTIQVLQGGAYPLQYDQRDATLRDSLRATAWASLLILGITILTLRRPRIVILVFLALAVGLAITFAVTALVIGTVNVITAFLLAILAGLGVDFGLYLATRVSLFERTGLSREAAVREAWIQTAVPAVMGALTTMAVMALLALGRFRGFAELGIICGVGIVVIYMTMYTLLPVLFLTLGTGRRGPVTSPGSTPAPVALDEARRLVAASEIAGHETRAPLFAPAGRHARWVLLAGLVVTVLAVLSGRRVRFEYSGEEITVRNQKSLQIDREIIKHYGENADQTVTLADSEERGRRIHAFFEERFGTFPAFARYESAFTYVPPADRQREGLAHMEPLRRALEKMPRKNDDPDVTWALAQARDIVNPEVLTLDGLPENLKEIYLGRDSNGKVVGYIGHILAKRWLWEIDQLTEFVNEVEALKVDGIPIETTGRPQIFMRVIQIVQREVGIFSLVATVLILLSFWIQMRSVRLALLAMSPLAIGVAWTLGCLPFVGARGLSLNFMNLIVLPILVGLGVSFGVQVVYAYRLYGSAAGGLRVVLRAVLGSSACTLVGWASLIPASMIGMQGIGWLATLGMIAVTVGALVLLPAMIAVLHARGWVRPRWTG